MAVPPVSGRTSAAPPLRDGEVWGDVAWRPGRKGGKKDARSWQEWREDLFWAQVYRFRGHPGFAPLEQYAIRSTAEQRCIECGSPGRIWHAMAPALIKSVDGYWFCLVCNNRWLAKADADRGARRLGDEYDGYPEHLEVLAG